MRIKQVRELLTESILTERLRCAGIADRHGARVVADEIRSARPPRIKVIRPETAVAHPERVDRETIVAGASYAGLD